MFFSFLSLNNGFAGRVITKFDPPRVEERMCDIVLLSAHKERNRSSFFSDVNIRLAFQDRNDAPPFVVNGIYANNNGRYTSSVFRVSLVPRDFEVPLDIPIAEKEM